LKKVSCSSARFAILTACLDNTSFNLNQKQNKPTSQKSKTDTVCENQMEKKNDLNVTRTFDLSLKRFLAAAEGSLSAVYSVCSSFSDML
jgi:hypothetical protein